jgi:ribosomal protein L40E
MVRRVIAIILMACTIVFLFWPSFVCGKTEYEGYGYSESHTEKTTLWEFRSSITEEMEQMLDLFGESTEGTITAILAIFINVAFFGMLALAGMAIVLMLFNRSKAATVLHTILAILTVVVYAAYLIYMMITLKEEYAEYGIKLTIYPGVAGILLPLFSLAASILYKRDTSYPGAVMPRAAQPAYANVPPVTRGAFVPQQPVKPAAPAEWICPSCTAKNDPSEPVCPYCGTQNPAPVVKREEVLFCTSCGAKQRPGATFCPQCGTKLN